MDRGRGHSIEPAQSVNRGRVRQAGEPPPLLFRSATLSLRRTDPIDGSF